MAWMVAGQRSRECECGIYSSPRKWPQDETREAIMVIQYCCTSLWMKCEANMESEVSHTKRGMMMTTCL